VLLPRRGGCAYDRRRTGLSAAELIASGLGDLMKLLRQEKSPEANR